MHKACMAIIYSLLICTIGCGGGNPDLGTVPVAGVVTLDNQPLAGARVYFMNSTYSGQAITDSEGKYELPQGAIPGSNTIYISKISGGEQGSPDQGMDAGQLEAAVAGAPTKKTPEGPQELIPPKFSDPMQTELTFEVPEDGSTSADFALTST